MATKIPETITKLTPKPIVKLITKIIAKTKSKPVAKPTKPVAEPTTPDKKKSWHWLGIIFWILFILWFIFPEIFMSEEEICDNAIKEAKYFLSNSDYELDKWLSDEYTLNKGEYFTTYSITNTECDVWDKDYDVEITLDMTMHTSQGRHTYIQARVSVTDCVSYECTADYVEFSKGY